MAKLAQFLGEKSSQTSKRWTRMWYFCKDFNDFKIKDIIEAYKSKTIERQISS